jgi:phosphoribosyl 1,2-cyclic phosphodiesterase
MKFSVLASGSEGNACYIEAAGSGILIDAGLSAREITRRLQMIGADPGSLRALVVTHEHTDHIRGAGPLARRLNIPVVISTRTWRGSTGVLGNIKKMISFHPGQSVTVEEFVIETFTKSHDATDPVGLKICLNGLRLGLITDIGRSTRLVEHRLRDCQGLIIEFNHDEDMLEKGPYPLSLKRRIKGPEGHLSNNQAGKLLKILAHEGLRHVVLAHLSRKNNSPELAYGEAEAALSERGLNRATRVVVSHQDQPLSLIDLS